MKKISRVSFFLIGIFLVFNLGCQKKMEEADLAFINGQIVTMDEKTPEAAAVAVRDGVIIAVGSREEINHYISDRTEVIDLEGKTLIPGFIDSHAHFMGIGRSKLTLDLRSCRSWGEIVEKVKKAVAQARPGEWILGRGWHQEKWQATPQPNIDGLPFHHQLSAVSPDNPVFLTHASGHSAIANARAMELAGVTSKTPDPEGGEIVRDKRGQPIGVFRETAQGLISRAYARDQAKKSPEERIRELEKIALLAAEECVAKGVTCVHDPGVSFETIDLYKRLIDEGRLKIRLYVMINESNDRLAQRIDEYRLEGYGQYHLTVRAIKRFMDGALGAHGAWLLEPYTDLPTSTGFNTTPLETIRQTALLAIENDWQLCIHAIGDRANREVLNIYEEVFKTHPEKKDLRWRIEHAQHLHPEDIPRFAQLGVIASMQGIHCTSDGPWVTKRLGAKRAAEGAYVWRKLLDSGALICNGTDAPVEDVDPIKCFYASVTRRLDDGSFFYPDQAMTREEALRSYTLNGALASFQEKILGSITPGKLADFVVLSQNILTCPDDQILQTEVLMTFIGGKLVYKKK
ncbi:MAG: amidohydrolase [Candidatus Aminicenantes bacterium 4484_214]|nr:amidohydrolase [Candidatus Aminicenantes bacterium]OQX51668.1 MAG: amidohydrolase [Candidatus Aminicenantes bacterium 4484_214]